ncbi:FtsB family cell division protein [Sanguibacter suaedae]|uniref:Septum formation initiator family protein n=1 Tax=Sanguibacter suaedae TaxID=2795737 RepID=A0A934M9K5_9MICO|nr:septum formation initiator family protein [Sanguibacter suaedae]MBI9114685.1 septum formation initiator family protein [Sanguibacter suaedae]
MTLVGVALVLPTAVQFLKQRAEIRADREEVAEMRASNEEMANELSRWDDDRYVVAQARERLTFVFPGETPFRVIDPEVVPVEPDATAGAPLGPGAVTSGIEEDTPWFESVWQSVEIAGSGHEPTP